MTAVLQRLDFDYDESKHPRDENGRWTSGDGGEAEHVPKGQLPAAAHGVATDAPGVFWHGSPSGDLRGGAYGLHLGTYRAATEALEARIGHPATGTWDGTRTYGETLLDRDEHRWTMDGPPSHEHPPGWTETVIPHEPTLPNGLMENGRGAANYSDGSPISLDSKPDIAPYRITGSTTNTPDTPHEDFKANGYMLAQIAQGRAKNGYYYTEVGEDPDSIAVVVPGSSHITRIGTVTASAVQVLELDYDEAKHPPWDDEETTASALVELEYDETKHPRGTDGRWTDGEGGDEFWRAPLPPAPGTTPIPEGHVRMYHYTQLPPGEGPIEERVHAVAESLREHGIQLGRAKGESYGEPNGVWASTQMPDTSTHVFVEFHVALDDRRWVVGNPMQITPNGKDYEYTAPNGKTYNSSPDSIERRGSNVAFNADILPSDIIAVHEPWHEHVRYFESDQEAKAAVKAGEHDNLLVDPEYGPAIRHVKAEMSVAQPLELDYDESKHPRAENGWWTAGDGGEVSSAAKDLRRTARSEEKTVTPLLQDLASRSGGHLVGLNSRLKSEESLSRKLRDKVAEGRSAEEARDSVKDALRYTVSFDTSRYTVGTTEVLSGLAMAGYREVDAKNFWQRGDDYQGINTVWQAPSGALFEVQFHTDQSYAMREAVHPAYEKYRLPDTSPQERYRIYHEAVEKWNDVPTPLFADAIGRPAFQTLRSSGLLLVREADGVRFRLREDGQAQYVERWDGTEWVDSPASISYFMGMDIAEDVEVTASVQPLEFGEAEGHPFRGNQWTSGLDEFRDGQSRDTLDSAFESFRTETIAKIAVPVTLQGKHGVLSLSKPRESSLPNTTRAELRDRMLIASHVPSGRVVLAPIIRDGLKVNASLRMTEQQGPPSYSKGAPWDRIKQPAGAFVVQQMLEFFDESQHPRDENGRWTDGNDGTAGETEAGAKGNGQLSDALLLGKSMLSGVTEEMREQAKAEIVKRAGADIAAAAKNDPAVRAEYEEWGAVTRTYPTERTYGSVKAQEYIDSWASSAADGNVTSNALQQVTDVELDAYSASYNIFFSGNADPRVSDVLIGHVADTLEREGQTMRVFVRGEYDRTQEFLKENGIKEVTLYRGMTFEDDDVDGERVNTEPSGWEDGKAVRIDMNPSSSWSTEREVAENFAESTATYTRNFVITMSVPAEDIISTARTGRGALIEAEVLVRNQPGAVALLERVGYVDEDA